MLKSHLEDGTLAVLLAADKIDNVFAKAKHNYEFEQLVYFYTNDIPSINTFSGAPIMQNSLKVRHRSFAITPAIR